MDGTDRGRASPSKGKHPKNHLLRRLGLVTDILYSVMITLNHALTKCTVGGLQISKSQEKKNHIMYIDDVKVYAKSWKT